MLGERACVTCTLPSTVCRCTLASSSAPLPWSAEGLAKTIGAHVPCGDVIPRASGWWRLWCPRQEAEPHLRGVRGGQYPHVCYESLPACQ